MHIPGRVKNGVVVLEGGAVLPEGAAVVVSCDKVPVWSKPGKKKRVKLRLVRSGEPGSLMLSNERIAEILEEEDVATYGKFFRKPKRS